MKILFVLFLLTVAACAMECDSSAGATPQEPKMTFAEKQQAILPIFQQRCNDTAILAKMRDQFAVTINNKTPFLASLEFSYQMRHYIHILFIQEMNKLEQCPSTLAVVLFGSLPRLEASPYTDLEYGIVVAEDSEMMRKYCFKLAQRVADRLYTFGESEAMGGKGFQIDGGNVAPLHFNWHHRYANVEDYSDYLDDPQNPKSYVYQLNNPEHQISAPVFCGSRLLTGDCNKFASYSKAFYPSSLGGLINDAYQTGSKEAFFSKLMASPCTALEGRFASATLRPNLRNHTVLLNIGEQNLSMKLHLALWNVAHSLDQDDRQQLLPTIRTNVEMMRKNIAALKNKEFYTFDSLETISFKKDIYRFAEQMLTGLSGLFCYNSQNTWETLCTLGNGVINKKGQLTFYGRDVPADIAAKLLAVLVFSMNKNFHQQFLAQGQEPVFILSSALYNQNVIDVRKALATTRDNIETLRHERGVVEESAMIDADDFYEKLKTLNSKLNECFNDELNLIKSLYVLKAHRPDGLMTDEDMTYLQFTIIPNLKDICDYLETYLDKYMGNLAFSMGNKS